MKTIETMPSPQADLFNNETDADRMFKEYNEKHPEVYQLFVHFAIQSFKYGRKKFGAKAIMERARWEAVTTFAKKAADFKIDNNYTSRYIRKFLKDHPSYKDMFELRTLKS